MNTDPVADMFTRIRNAYMARKLLVEMPYSRLKHDITQILEEFEFVGKASTSGKGHEKKIEIELSYDSGGEPMLEQINRVSKPSRRVYVRGDQIKRVKGGFGISIISTSKGVMSGQEAKKKNIGGEVLAHVW